MQGVALALRLAGFLVSLMLIFVGVFLGIFGDVNAAARWTGPAVHPAFVLLGMIMLHAIPAGLFLFVRNGSPILCVAMLLLSPIVAWRGIDSLFVRGDWGDFVLWGPYLLSGVLMAATGLILLARRSGP
jgi:hypothetical protein